MDGAGACGFLCCILDIYFSFWHTIILFGVWLYNTTDEATSFHINIGAYCWMHGSKHLFKKLKIHISLKILIRIRTITTLGSLKIRRKISFQDSLLSCAHVFGSYCAKYKENIQLSFNDATQLWHIEATWPRHQEHIICTLPPSPQSEADLGTLTPCGYWEQLCHSSSLEVRKVGGCRIV